MLKQWCNIIVAGRFDNNIDDDNDVYNENNIGDDNKNFIDKNNKK